MKLKISLIFILIILITVLTFGAVVNAEEFIIKPEKVNYYDSIYSATPGGSSFFDPNKTYNSFFSPYAKSEVKVNSSFDFSINFDFRYQSISGILTDAQINNLINAISSYFFLIRHNGSGSFSYDIKEVQHVFHYDQNYFQVAFNIKYNSNLIIPSGTLGFYNVKDYNIWGPIFEIGLTNYFSELPYVQNCYVSAFRIWTVSMSSNYELPIICTANNLVFVFKSGITSSDIPLTSFNVPSNLYLNGNLVDSRTTKGVFGGVYDLQFDNSLKNSHFNLSLSSSSDWSSYDDVSNLREVILFFEFGTLIPYSEDVGYSGGQNYGSWSSNSCDWYDIPCHLGNALGYFVYEFPLTKPITTLFTGLVGYLDTFFDISSEFSGVEVIYGVLITMIVVGIVVALFKG